MRKALILTVLALFGSEALAQNSFRHAPATAFDVIGTWERPIERPLKYDDVKDHEMASFGSFGGRGTIGGPTVLINRPTGGRMGMMDDYEDDAFLDIGYNYLDDKEFDRPGSPLFGRRIEFIPSPVPSDTFASQNPSFLGSGNSGVIVQGGNAPQGGIGAAGSAQFTGAIGNTGANYIVGAQFAHSPGAPISITPHVGISKSF